ncbi:hydroxymethylpyrimidine/phosphomethylpyrimidine kinase [Andreprevotia lacus DSM 23236]|jgi:hydroxymethylpyrimidine/phosphomethylpyrimidine kinase|uniref:hydroxymethylpyrimidine kinase n=1 Tax=Andreprevotia lacus DSM 23236 TaxID=1121001 RepID=A0A1W1XVT4_9NEIS|nr:bifunctional hydroxymethylpyrimidine kinase/phosphomethylpyrimidine kinase [Andreprevotia lacus]SMC27944.1 hydroxymethylpyrimidine/phosphomethylpyrimidine kinase [Andreprevotia lacus DSM 23236]
MTQQHYPRVLTIAGSDSGGGAGIQADLKTFAALGCFGMSAITALTAQNTLGVTAIHAVPADFLAAQIDAVFSDIGVDAVKIGMLHAPEVVDVVATKLRQWRPATVVLDPVMVATSGAKLIEDATISRMVAELFPLATVVTPNLDELALLVDAAQISDAMQLETAALRLLGMGCRAVLAKGGHLDGATVTDVLVRNDGHRHAYTSPRIASNNLHGTGCTLSSAIAAHSALGLPLEDAITAARSFIAGAIEHGATVKTGQGHGPLNHGYAPRVMRILD